MKLEKNYKTRAEDERFFDELSKCKHKCKNCGHVVVLSNFNRVVCSHCGHYVFKTDADEFKFRLNEKLGKRNEF